MSSIFGGGTSKASRQSVENQKQQNAQTQAFIERQTGRARNDVLSLYPQGDTARNAGFQSSLDMIAAGVDPQISAFQQGNVGAQNILNMGRGSFNNAILGAPTTELTPQSISVDTTFLQNPKLPDFQPLSLPTNQTPDYSNILSQLGMRRAF